MQEWTIDPCNTTGAASDAHHGTPQRPLRTFREMVRRLNLRAGYYLKRGAALFLCQDGTWGGPVFHAAADERRPVFLSKRRAHQLQRQYPGTRVVRARNQP